MNILFDFLQTTGFYTMTLGNAVMIVVGMIFIMLAITRHYEPLLLLPIGFGMIVGNIPTIAGMPLSVYDEGSVLSFIYFWSPVQGVFPPLIFLGIGAMTDFSTLLSNPKLILLGAAAQIGVFSHVHRSTLPRLRAKRGGGHRNHRWRRWTDGDLFGRQN